MEQIEAIMRSIQQALGIESKLPILFKWQINSPDIDLAFRLHAFLDQQSKELHLLEILHAAHSQVAAFSIDSGYLNLRFSPKIWMDFVLNWRNSKEKFLEAAGLLEASNNKPKIEEKLLKAKDIHFLAHARAVAMIPDWDLSDNPDFQALPEHISILKEILRLGNGRDIGLEERTRAAKSLVLALRKLWQDPILSPMDPLNSRFRQQILRFGIQAAVGILGESILYAPVE